MLEMQVKADHTKIKNSILRTALSNQINLEKANIDLDSQGRVLRRLSKKAQHIEEGWRRVDRSADDVISEQRFWTKFLCNCLYWSSCCYCCNCCNLCLQKHGDDKTTASSSEATAGETQQKDFRREEIEDMSTIDVDQLIKTLIQRREHNKQAQPFKLVDQVSNVDDLWTRQVDASLTQLSIMLTEMAELLEEQEKLANELSIFLGDTGNNLASTNQKLVREFKLDKNVEKFKQVQ